MTTTWEREPEGDQTLEDNWLFRLRRERYRSRASGRSHDYYVIHLADAVNVIALTPDRQLVMVRQFRAGSGHDSLETPGGLLEPGEDPLVAGARELREETGYEGDPPRLIGTVWANSSLLTSKSITVLIPDVRLVAEPHLDPGEEVRVELVPAREVPAKLRDGEIDHALVVAGLLRWLVSELPGPLAIEGPKGRPTFRISWLMMAIAVISGGLSLLNILEDRRTAASFRELLVALIFGEVFAGAWFASAQARTTLVRAQLETDRPVRLLIITYGRIALWYLVVIGFTGLILGIMRMLSIRP